MKSTLIGCMFRNLCLVFISLSFLSGCSCWKNKPVGTASENDSEENSVKINGLDKEEYKDRLSYYLGIQAGIAIKFQNFDIDKKQFYRGFDDYLENDKNLPKEKDVSDFIFKAQLEKQKEKNAQYSKSEQVGRDFLLKNGGRKEVVSNGDKLQYEIIKEGKGEAPGLQDKVKIHLIGKLIDGKEFMNTVSTKKPIEYTVIEMIPGLRTLVQMMKPGSHYKVYLAPELAYGLRGYKEVPPQTTVIFDFQLLEVIRAKKETSTIKKPVR